MRVSVTELKNKLSQYLRLVKRGESIEILERSVPIARIEGLSGAAATGDDRLTQLVRDGVILPPRKPAATDLLSDAPVRVPADPVATLIEERATR